MKIMISQSMRGKTEEQIRKEREEIIKQLETEGHKVVDTIFKEEPPKQAHPGIWYLAKSIEAISKVDGVVFMNGWENARGCRIEHQVATAYGKFIKIL